MNNLTSTVARLACALSLIPIGAPFAFADEVTDFYKGKQVKLVIGYPPSSGHSLYGQMLSRHIGNHIPGKPKIIPQNKPGAGSMVAANWMYNVAPRDGSVIGIFALNIAIDSLYEGSKAKFNAKEFHWLGSMAPIISVCAVSPKAPIWTFDELLKKEVIFGATGRSGGTFQYATALTNLMKAKIKIIRGYKAGSAIMLAMERGEVQGRCAFPLGNYEQKFKSGEMIPIIHDFNGKVSRLPNVPSVYNYAKTKEDHQVYDLLFGWHAWGRPVSTPPGVPSKRLSALRDAFMATMKDPDFLADARKSSLTVDPTSGAEMQEKVLRLLRYPKDVVKKASNAVR